MRGWQQVALAVTSVLLAASAHAQLVDAPPAPPVVAPLVFEGPKFVVPLTLLSGTTLSEARTLQVRVGDAGRPALTSAFTSKLLGPDRVEVQVEPRVNTAGRYSVLIELHGTAANGASPVRQTLEVTWVHAAATLAPTARLVVSRVWPAREPAIELVLRETSGVALSNVSISEPQPPTHDGVAVQASLQPLEEIPAIPAGGARTIALPARGSFPKGTTTGSLEIRAPQLQAPVMVPYEVRTRWSDIFVIPVFLAAGALGWLFRKYLKERESALAFSVELETLKTEARRVSWEAAPMNDALQKLADKAENAIADKGNARAELDELRRAIQATLAERDARIAALLIELEPLKQAVDPPWQLPPTQSSIEPIRILVGTGLAALSRSDVRTGQQSVQDARTKLEGIRQDVSDWSRAQLADAERLNDLPPPLLDALASLGSVSSSAGFDWLTYLRKAHESHVDLVRLTRERASVVRSEAKAAADELRGQPGKEDVCAKLDGLAESIQIENASLRSVANAFEELRQLVPAKQAGLQLVAKSLSARMEPSSALGRERSSRLVVLRSESDAVTVARAHLQRVTGVRTVLSVAFLSVIAWLVYRDAWLGTLDDFVAVAAAGFFTDFTVDAVIEAVGRLRKEPQ